MLVAGWAMLSQRIAGGEMTKDCPPYLLKIMVFVFSATVYNNSIPLL